MGNETAARVVARIRKVLQEDTLDARQRIGRIVRSLGAARALALLAETKRVETSGGMLTQDGQRRRTAGGVFYYLVRGELQGQRRYADLHFIWPDLRTPKAPRPEAVAVPPHSADQPLDLAELCAHLTDQGAARTVKITIIGRPGEIHEQGAVVVFLMQPMTVPRLPKGVPLPPTGATYVVTVAAKQWRTVVETLDADPDDQLIIEGYAGHAADDPSDVVRVSAMAVRSRNQQRRQRQEDASS